MSVKLTTFPPPPHQSACTALAKKRNKPVDEREACTGGPQPWLPGDKGTFASHLNSPGPTDAGQRGEGI